MHRRPYQVVVTVLGAQHGGHLPQVGSVALLIHTAGEGDGNDPLCDVDQVQLIALIQGLQQAHTPVREKRSIYSLLQDVSKTQTALGSFA